MTLRATTYVSHLYHEQHAGAVFGDLRYGGDVLALSSGRVDRGRLELHHAAEAEAARTGLSYEDALDAVLAQAKHGLRTLSAAALEGTGVRATIPGRNGLRHLPRGEVVTLSAGAAVSLAEPPEQPQDSARFLDSVVFCESRKPGASETSHSRSVETVMARAGSTGDQQVTRWLAQGGAEAAFR